MPKDVQSKNAAFILSPGISVQQGLNGRGALGVFDGYLGGRAQNFRLAKVNNHCV